MSLGIMRHARVARNRVIDVRAPPIMMEAFRVLHDVRKRTDTAVVRHMHMQHSRLIFSGCE